MNGDKNKEQGNENNKLMADICDWLLSEGYNLLTNEFRKAIILIKKWEDKKSASELNSDQIFEIVLRRIREYEEQAKQMNKEFNYQDFTDYNNNCR